MAVYIIPANWYTPERANDVADLLAVLPIDPEDRKVILLEWADIVNIRLTRELVLRAKAAIQ